MAENAGTNQPSTATAKPSWLKRVVRVGLVSGLVLALLIIASAVALPYAAPWFIQQQGIDFHYTIIGAKGVEELEYQRSELNLIDQITFLDRVPYEEVLDKMQQAHIVLLPSVEEGIANVILEAMMLQKLVLTTNCGGMEEIVKDRQNGFVVPIRNPQQMSEKIMQISELSPSQIKEITTQARITIETINSEQKMVADMKSLYDFVLNPTSYESTSK